MYEEYVDCKSVENLLRAVGSKGLRCALPDRDARMRYSDAWNSLSEEEKKLLRILYMTSEPNVSRMDVVYRATKQMHMEQTKIYRMKNAVLKKLRDELFGKIFMPKR